MAEAPQDVVNQSGEPSLSVAKTDSTPNHQRTGTDPDAQAMVISSLRSQIQDLFSQVTQLNNKLVQSYDRVSDLEDDLHTTSSNLRSSTLKVSQLELERTQHLSALNTGLLVEKSHVTAELTRLMEKATEEAAQRGQAETARADIEKDLDDLSASLFGQANTMVAEARYAQALSERKVEEAELALKGAEEAVGIMQQQMQALHAEKEEAEKSAQNMQVVMGKGKWVDRQEGTNLTRSIRLLSSHLPYQEFLLFVAHLRSIHPTSPNPPVMSTLLPLPFLARLLTEDSEPTVRLDLAPSLNWLTRRSVLSAIHNGQLTIEPMSSNTLLHESSSYATSSPGIPGLNSSSNSNISCALCGTSIFSNPDAHHHSRLPSLQLGNISTNSWSTAIFKKPLSYTNSANNSPPPTPPPRSTSHTPFPPQPPQPPQIHIFRLASPASSAASLPSSIPIPLPVTSTSSFAASAQPSHHLQNQNQPAPVASSAPSTIYPLCPNGWCLTRLRTTCILWAFVRTGIVEKIWEEEVPTLLPPSIPSRSASRDGGGTGEKPLVPPRRRGLWGMASALSWSEGDKKPQVQEKEKRLPQPPPPLNTPVVAGNFAPQPVAAPKPETTPAPPPSAPPLPKRSQGRGRNVTAPTTPVRRKSPPDASGASPAPTSNAPTPGQGSTPVEEKPNPVPTQVSALQRPHSPALIPLPESRPTTPSIPAVVGVPSRTASPVPSAAPVAGGGAVPPPLPRRAAARRPMSSIGATALGASSRPGSPAPAAPAPPAVSTPTPVPAVESKDVAAPGSESGSEGKAKEEKTTSDVAESGDGGVVHGGEKKVEDKVEGGATGVHEVSVVNGNGEEKGAQAGEGGEDVALVTSPVDALDKDGTPKGGNVLLDNGDAEKSMNGVKGVEGEKEREVDKEKEEEDKEKDEEDKEEDKEAYVGDATWEERTWKELVRLREQMFWARVGGLR